MQINHTHIQKLIDQIETTLEEEVNAVRLADSFHMSPWHFQRTFKSIVGDTLGSYIRGRRLTRAAQLLCDTDRTIIDIALNVGFNSHEAFTRSFRSYFQYSPKEFRKKSPPVLLAQKPLLTVELYKHLAKGMEQNPIIKQMPEQHTVGFDTSIPSPFIYNENYCDLLYRPWTTLLEKEKQIENRIPETYYGLTISPSGTFMEQSLSYIAGAAVTSLDEVPSGMASYSFPEQLVAMFDIFAGTEDSTTKTVDYIYGYWLPNSPYTRANGNDYELFEKVSNFEDPNLRSKYVVPIATKK